MNLHPVDRAVRGTHIKANHPERGAICTLRDTARPQQHQAGVCVGRSGKRENWLTCIVTTMQNIENLKVGVGAASKRWRRRRRP